MYMEFVLNGNTGCGVFKRGVTKLQRYLPKNQHNQRKLLRIGLMGGLGSFLKIRVLKVNYFHLFINKMKDLCHFQNTK